MENDRYTFTNNHTAIPSKAAISINIPAFSVAIEGGCSRLPHLQDGKSTNEGPASLVAAREHASDL